MNFSQDEEDNSFSLKKFESMLKTNKVFFFDSEEFEDIVLHYMDSGKMNLAKKALRLGLEQHPKSVGLKLVQVEMFIYEDKLEPAEKILAELEVIEPTNEEIFIQRANILSKKDLHNEAIEQLKIALSLTEDEAEIYSMIGMEYLFSDELELAKQNFIACLEKDDEEYAALYNVVYCFDFLDQNQEAIVFLEKFINKHPYSEVAWHQLGRQFYTIKNYEKAVWAFDYASLIDEGFLGAFIEKAKSLEKLKRYEEAIINYQIANQLDDPTSFSLLRIGKCFEKMGNLDEALQYYLKTTREDPLLDKAWLALTEFYIKQNNNNKALYYLNKALNIDAENWLYWRKYAYINHYIGMFEEAELGYRKANEYGDFDLDNYTSWADVLQILDETNFAIEILVQAEELYKNEPEIAYRLIGLYFLNNDVYTALEKLNDILNINYKGHKILKKIFPEVWKLDLVQLTLAKYKK